MRLVTSHVILYIRMCFTSYSEWSNETSLIERCCMILDNHCTNLLLVSRCLTRPLVEMSVDVAVVATENGVEDLVRYVESID